MAREPTWKQLAQIKRKVATHDRQIDDLYEMSRADHKTLALHGRELDLLRELTEAQSRRITHVRDAAARAARRMASGARRK